MSTLVAGELDVVFTALRDVFREAGEDTVMVVTLSNACPPR